MDEEIQFDEELAREVATEGLESLESVMPALMAWKSDPSDDAPVNELFRCFHSIKGNSGMVGLLKISKFAHEAENVLNLIRQGNIEPTQERILLFVEAVDMMTGLLDGIDFDSGAEPFTQEHAGYLERLVASASQDSESDDPSEDIIGALLKWIEEAEKDEGLADHPKIAELKKLVQAAAGTESEDSSAENPETTPETTGASSPEAQSEGPEQTEAAKDAPPGKAKKGAVQQGGGQKGANSTLRVDVESIDNVMKLGGELFNIDERLKFLLDENFVIKDENARRSELRGIARDFDSTMDRLYDQMLDIQKVPVIQLTRPLERIIRDVCRKQGKEIEMVVKGDSIRLDKQILDALHDPLVHMIRNSVDHGIEPPDERVANGKPRVGTLELHFVEGEENIEVTIIDDGRGINLEAVRAKAIKQGLLTEEEAETIADRDLVEFVFRPGFSTVEKVSDLSGRGVGMDVVMSNLRTHGGSISTKTEWGKGTTFTLFVPKPGSPVIEGLVIRLGRVKYLVPLKGVHRFVSWTEVDTSIIPGGFVAANLPEGSLPVMKLDSLDGRENTVKDDGIGLILEDREGENFILHVDEVLGRQKALVIDIDGWFDKTETIHGAFILGDGSIGFTLKVEDLRHLEPVRVDVGEASA